MKRQVTRTAAKIIAAVTIAWAPAAQTATPMDVWSGICEAVGGLQPVIAAFCKVTDKAVALSGPQDPTTLRDLYLKVVSMEIDLHDLEGQVANLSYEQRREEALALARAIEQERAQVYAALDVAADRRGDSAAQTQALAAAHALASPTFYTLPGRTVGAPDRFDPRAALPSFVVAVEMWLVIRASANEQWTDVSRQDVIGFAARLLQITAQMRASVHCEESWQNFVRFSCPKPDKGGPHIPLPMSRDRNPPDATNCVPSPACNHRLSCTDEMNEETNATGKTSDGTCPADTATNARSNRESRLIDYHVEQYEAIARRWLATPH